MDEVDLWVVKSLIESKTGSSSRRCVSGENPNFFLDEVVHTSPTIRMIQERNFDVFCIEQGVPDLFTFTGFSQPVICYHLGYVGKFIKFRNYIMEDPDKPRILQDGIANLFELISAFYLQGGKGTFATTCLLQSIMETSSRAADKDVYDYINYEQYSFFYNSRSINEAAFTLLYFGLAHEMGHTYANDCVRTSTKAHSKGITDKAIAKMIIKSAKSAFKVDSEYMFSFWYENYLITGKDKGSVLHCENLRSEILADNLGLNILITSMGAFARYTNQKLNFKIIVSEVIICLFVVQLMEACKHIVKALPAEKSNIEFELRYFPIRVNDASLTAELYAHQMIYDFQIAHIVRWEYLKPSLTKIALMHLFPDTWTIKGRTLTANCSPLEFKRREAIAVNAIEGYSSFYSKEMLKFQASLGVVVNFVGHMITDKVPEVRTKHSVNENFADHIDRYFQKYLGRLTGEKGIKRKQEILAQLTEHKSLLLHWGKESDAQSLDKILHLLELELNEHKK
jgi:hypothetical protein